MSNAASSATAKVVIVGGGVMGAATACFLARDHGLKATVLERDPSYARASSSLSASSIRQQFSTAVNIRLSLWSVAFLRRIGQELAVGEDVPHIGLREAGYLYLSKGEGAATALRQQHAVQREHGADVLLLAAAELQARFPWLCCNDVLLGSWGQSGEGWFDGPALHQAFRRKAIAHGARFVAGEAIGFANGAGEGALQAVGEVLCASGQRLPCDAVVLAGGAWTAGLAAQLGVALPVAPKKRDVFVFDSPAQLPNCPLLIDPSGFWLRPEGGGFLCGAPPREPWPGDPDEPPLEAIDHTLFEEHIWPAMAQRIPALEALRLRSAWAGYYEMNAFDHNGLAGPLPGWTNAFTACGFSGHGMQQAPAVGAGLAQQVAAALGGAPPGALAQMLQGLAVQRLVSGQPLREANVIG